ncbi:SDR family NAD(P)-dependent oxidoreductase [Clostridium algidicarnis]|uniref:SDR family NAD(P)-dependent oxidoreductase n=1 Tax=Clostridium algidicarnis TaxID=37659 RepID=UPI001C0CBD56|nr:SDR family oxidoreductase [Clostridium algidicarnis]MBU3229208.1 SDR family oxidoreductase [Clostridium algidicarnis]MBU3252722.1 SDR family oxidoreductase [Clostridium algidicarnis]
MDSKMIDFTDKGILISGAAGAVGISLCECFNLYNATLILIDLSEKELELIEIQKQFSEKGIKIYYYCIDIRHLESINNLINFLKDVNIKIDVLINNAGVNFPIIAREMTEEIWDNVIDTNLKGTFFLTRGIANYSLLERKGNIVNISSQHSIVGNEKRVHYCASKTGVLGMTRALAYEWSKYQVRVNCISPTYIISEKNKTYFESPFYKRSYLEKIPLGRYAQPIDVAKSVLFLASSMASMITGHNLVVDGGYTVI